MLCGAPNVFSSASANTATQHTVASTSWHYPSFKKNQTSYFWPVFFPRFTPSHEQSVAVFIENSSQSVLIRVSEALELSSQLHHCIRRIIGRLIQHSVTHWHLLMREVFEANKPWHATSRTEKWSRLWQIFPLLQTSKGSLWCMMRPGMLWCCDPPVSGDVWVRINMLINTNRTTILQSWPPPQGSCYRGRGGFDPSC